MAEDFDLDFGEGVPKPWTRDAVLAAETFLDFLFDEEMIGELGLASITLGGVLTLSSLEMVMDLADVWPMSFLGVTLTGVTLELQWVVSGDWLAGDRASLDTALLGVLFGVLKMAARCGDW